MHQININRTSLRLNPLSIRFHKRQLQSVKYSPTLQIYKLLNHSVKSHHNETDRTEVQIH